MKKIIPLIATILCACNNQEVTVKNITIEAELLTNIAPLYYSPYSFFYDEVDSSLLLNMTRGEFCVLRIDPNDGKADSLIRAGRGRNEHIQLRVTDIDEKGNFYGTDHPVSFSHTRNASILDQYNYSKTNNQMFWTNRFHDKYVVYGNYDYPHSLLTLYDNSWQELCHFGKFPNDGISESIGGKMGKIMAYQGIILSCDQSSRIAFISRSGEFFSIYDIDERYNTELVYTIQRNLPVYKAQGGSFIGVTTSSKDFYYTDAYSTDDRIYILYSGKEIQAPNNIAYMEARLSNKIMVFDWDGNHLCNLNSELDMQNICMSNDDKELYAVYFDDDAEYRLCRFDISEI